MSKDALKVARAGLIRLYELGHGSARRRCIEGLTHASWWKRGP